ncbi:glycosyltransferase family 1 protein [Neobacillus ginsengisoli]|uniref:Glycosyltransferase involved in cell wall biosynthesis n=1 Tax=Neobacillus ginsengisoli TaxID=904295 RepID=A0ABT9XTA7_9BACI|nr:glycosyltransferase family 1 protein [Neobacillus ginsengisoli]MDQ0198788.1 glycosyltransferase involved in cell wall biosynthesis [Neobacillus ginsengisoli]
MGSPLRILHVVVNMNRGGAETLIMNLYRNIDRSKVQFDFLTCKEGVFDSEILKMGGNVHRIPYISDVGHFKYVNELDHFFSANNQYKIVHSHMDKMTGLVLRSAKRAGIPIRISHSHNTSSEGGFAARVYKWYIGKYILTSATNLFACSNKAADWLFTGKSNSAKILKNGIESEKFAYSPKIRKEIREELNLTNQFVIGHIGRFAHQKNHHFLIEIFSNFSQINNDSVLILVGDGPLRVDIEKQVRDLNLVDKVKFVGIRSDIHRLLQAFDVLVFPSLHEGLPVSLIEAQGAGLPCLISDNISQEVDLGCNLVDFIPLTDLKQWVQKIKGIEPIGFNRRIASNSISIQGYDIKETAGNIEEFYLSISG